MDLIDQLLQTDSEKRLGCQSYSQLKNHPFFKDINFSKLEKKELKVPNLEFFHQQSDSKAMTEENQNINNQPQLIKKLTRVDKTDQDILATTFSMIDMNNKVMEGIVKVRRQLLFSKKRKMILMDNGVVYFLRPDNKFKYGLKLDEDSYIVQTKSSRFTIQTP